MLVNKSHPALKHGGYSTTTILPTESVAEFEKLHRDLISELVPNGALADDIVATIMRMVWRKRNLPTFRTAVVARFNYEIVMSREFSRMLPEQTLPPELQGRAKAYADAKKFEAINDVARKELGDDAYKLANVGETATVNGPTFRTAGVARQHHREIVRRELDTYYARDLTESGKEAREWYGMTEETELRRKADLAEREKAIRAADDIARHALGDMYELAKMADTVTVACLMKDLAVEERLDAAIDKCLKQLLFVKGLKSISASSSSAPPKRVAGSSEAA